MLNECAVRGKNVIIEPGQQACYVHVDDGVLIGDPKDCRGTDAMMHVCADALEESGFQVDDRQGNDKLEKIRKYNGSVRSTCDAWRITTNLTSMMNFPEGTTMSTLASTLLLGHVPPRTRRLPISTRFRKYGA